MSITLSNGVVLPDIPSTIPEEYSFRAIVKVTASGGICVAATPSSLLMVPAAVSGSTCDMLFSEATSHYLCALSEDGSTWGEAALVNNAPGYNLSTQEIVWANHDILVVTFGSADGITVGTEIYFPSSVKSNFILPDGTELPALPDGVFETYPYGLIAYVEDTEGNAAYALTAAAGTYIFAPDSATGEGADYLFSLATGYRHYRYVVAPTVSSGWEMYAESTTQYSGHDFSSEDGTIEVRWANHDILTLTEIVDSEPVYSPDLYRKSDVNYRIYGGWLNSMGNQARRLGNVSGARKPGEMETVLNGVTIGGSNLINAMKEVF